MAKIVTFGEIMLRLAPFHYQRFIQADQFQATYGGGEANVAVSLAHYGNEVYFVTRLPLNSIGDAAENSMRKYGVKTDFILRGGSRVGIYFLEHGASIRPSKVVYDRADSAVSQLETGMINWKEVFQGKDWFHITGITPALAPNCAEVAIESVKAAKEAGLKVSCDLNYRKKLWTKDEAKATMTKVVEYVDVIVANEEDAADVFGIHADETDVTSGKLNIEKYKSVASRLKDFCNAELVTITLRESISASDNGWAAMLFDGNEYIVSRKYPIHLIDRVGGGDSFGAGLIHGILKGWDKKQVLEFAVAASALKQTIPGDMNLVNEDEVMTVVKGDISGRVQR
jgi:2-dehydro-3-deoxygluconokinase